MHDPMTVAREIHVPIPQRLRWRERHNEGPRWAFGRRRFTGGDVGRVMYRPWWPHAWEPTIAGRKYGWRSVATIWHVEPKGHDSGEVCPHYLRGDLPSKMRVRLTPGLKWHDGDPDGVGVTHDWVADRRWKWHVHHWHIQIHLEQRIRRFLLERCEECGRRFPWGYAPISHSWDAPGSRWRDGVVKRAYHHKCSSLVRARQSAATDERLILSLFSAFRVATDESELGLLDRLTDPKVRSMEFGDARRLAGILGFTRDDAYNLVPTEKAQS